MIKKLMQKRYIGLNDANNNISFSELQNPISFLGQTGTPSGKKVVSIGVQAPKGTIALINNNQIIIGSTGIFEWDVEDLPGSYITSFCFSGILDENNTYIVDFCYVE